MIKGKGTDKDGRPVYVFGLSHKNLEMLKAGNPIPIKLEQLGGVGEVLIYAGVDEATMERELRESIEVAKTKPWETGNGNA